MAIPGVKQAPPPRIDRNHPLPLWAQVEHDLRRRLLDGEFEDRFPTDMDLVEQYGVSRHTVRDAVGRLCDEGLLERQRGRGTVVRHTEFEQPLGTLYSLFRSVEGHGVDQHSQVLTLEETTSEEAAARLALPPDAPVVHLRRLRFAGDEPLALDDSWLPADVARPLLDADFGHTALYIELAERCGVRVVTGWERIRPVVPAEAEQTLLGLPPGEAALEIERVARDGRGGPVDWRTSLVRGDRYGFVVEWPNPGRGGQPFFEALGTET